MLKCELKLISSQEELALFNVTKEVFDVISADDYHIAYGGEEYVVDHVIYMLCDEVFVIYVDSV